MGNNFSNEVPQKKFHAKNLFYSNVLDGKQFMGQTGDLLKTVLWIPQGSVLGPVLFLRYINSLVEIEWDNSRYLLMIQLPLVFSTLHYLVSVGFGNRAFTKSIENIPKIFRLECKVHTANLLKPKNLLDINSIYD